MNPQIPDGSLVQCTVQNVRDFGAFVAVEGIDAQGLVLIPEITWGRCKHPSEYLEAGRTYTMVVLRHAPEDGRISLSLKRLSPDPWELLKEKLRVGACFAGTVLVALDYGLFVEVAEHVEGLIHIEELRAVKPDLHHPSEFAQLGEFCRVQIVHVAWEERKLSLRPDSH
jgi:small subunit ribosomal protein S1